jgi:hypothetical protein
VKQTRRAVAAFCLYEALFYLACGYGMSFSHVTATAGKVNERLELCGSAPPGRSEGEESRTR